MTDSVVFWGIGSSIMGDDGAGPSLAMQLEKLGLNWLDVYNCETVPENYLAPLREMAPGTLIIADAAQMDLEAGEIRRMGLDDFSNVTFTTHGMPLDLLLADFKGKTEIIAIGIQPLDSYPCECLSPPVESAVNTLCRLIERKEWEKIPSFHQEKRSPR